MDLQLGKQKRMMYARVFDRTEEETCSVDAVVPDALGDIGAIVVAGFGVAFSGVMALLAAFIPARNAMRVSPNEAIRAQ